MSSPMEYGVLFNALEVIEHRFKALLLAVETDLNKAREELAHQEGRRDGLIDAMAIYRAVCEKAKNLDETET
jgi:hypothetical protein